MAWAGHSQKKTRQGQWETWHSPERISSPQRSSMTRKLVVGDLLNGSSPYRACISPFSGANNAAQNIQGLFSAFSASVTSSNTTSRQKATKAFSNFCTLCHPTVGVGKVSNKDRVKTRRQPFLRCLISFFRALRYRRRRFACVIVYDDALDAEHVVFSWWASRPGCWQRSAHRVKQT